MNVEDEYVNTLTKEIDLYEKIQEFRASKYFDELANSLYVSITVKARELSNILKIKYKQPN